MLRLVEMAGAQLFSHQFVQKLNKLAHNCDSRDENRKL